MGQHTWFYKNKELYQKVQQIEAELFKHDEGEIWLDNYEVLQAESDDLSSENDAGYHDCFRTFKRLSDGQYTSDVIYSEKECKEWLRANEATVYSMDFTSLCKFWEEYPDGVIDFG